MVEVHHVLRHIGLLFDQLVVEAAAQHAEHARQIDLLLVDGACDQHIFVLVVAHDHDIGLDGLDAQHQVGEVTRWGGVWQHLFHLKSDAREFGIEQLGGAGAELGVFVHDHGGLGYAAGSLVHLGQAGKGIVHTLAVARGQAEHVFQAAADQRVRHADVDQERGVVLGGSLGGGQRNTAGKAAHIGRDAVLLHALDFAHAHFWARLRVAQHGLKLGAAHGLDAACGIDLINSHHAAQARLAAAVGQRATDRVQQADLDRLGLGQQQAGGAEYGGGGAGLQNQAARYGMGRTHGNPLGGGRVG